MSQENVDVVLASIDAYNAEDLDAQIETYATVAVAVLFSDFPQSTPIAGREAIRGWIAEARQYFRFRYNASEVRPLGHDQVVCQGGLGGTGVASGIEAYQSVSVVFTLRDGLICRVEFYADHHQALKAVGLEE